MAGKYVFTTPISEKNGSYHLAEGLKKIMSPPPPAAAQEEDFIPPEYLGEGRCARLLSNDSCDIFSNAKMERMVEEFGIDISAFSRKKMNFSMSCFETTPECRIAIEQITRCHYNGAIRRLYIESKAHELLAHCMDALQNKPKNNALSLSKSDVENLRRAKEIVDNHIANPITLAKLSRMAYLNEYKLKNGFKALFGKPVYTYLLDKRMEQARLLLEKRRFHVYEVAEMAGYADSSSFSKAFFKRYGYRPADVS
jgi:AraC-like DNA-binding protein